MINRFEWLKAVLRSKASTRAKTAAAALATEYANDETGQLNPGRDTLASYLGICERTITRALAELEDGGWLARGAAGRGRRSCLVLRTPSNVVMMLRRKGDSSVKDRREKGDSSVLKGRQFCPPHKGQEQSSEQRAHERAARCPAVSLRIIHDTEPSQITDWNAWLAGRELPPLQTLGVRGGDAEGPGYAMPLRWPPSASDGEGAELVFRYCTWAGDQQRIKADVEKRATG